MMSDPLMDLIVAAIWLVTIGMIVWGFGYMIVRRLVAWQRRRRI
jgi:hypothetical protein